MVMALTIFFLVIATLVLSGCIILMLVPVRVQVVPLTPQAELDRQLAPLRRQAAEDLTAARLINEQAAKLERRLGMAVDNLSNN